MKVFLNPVGLYSRAMTRIANALSTYKPDSVEIVNNEQGCDLSILYVIGFDYIERAEKLLSSGKKYACVQCCVKSILGFTDYTKWQLLWSKSTVVWSYYDLTKHMPQGSIFYYAPLGLDSCFTYCKLNGHERKSIVTTGYVSGPYEEAIEEVWLAANQMGIPVIHIGPSNVSGINFKPPNVVINTDVPDDHLIWYLSGAKYVCSFRHTEGFELPAVEGLACGARPIVFNQPDLRNWYRNRAIYVEECHGQELIDKLVNIFSVNPRPVDENERLEVLRRFNWKAICEGFWSTMLREV